MSTSRITVETQHLNRMYIQEMWQQVVGHSQAPDASQSGRLGMELTGFADRAQAQAFVRALKAGGKKARVA